MKLFTSVVILLLINSIDTSGQAVTGSGTLNYVPKFTGASILSNSLIFDNGTNVGIGTITPGAKLEISNGTNSFKFDPGTSVMTISGPSATLSQMPRTNYSFNGDPNAVISFLTYAHDNTALSFDAYHNGTSWVSSHAGANFALYKTASELVIGYNSGTAAGSLFAAYNLTNAIRFSNNGSLGVGGAAGSAKLYVNGNAGIGTATPAMKLDIQTSTVNDGIRLGYSTTGSLRICANSLNLGTYNPLTQAGDAGIIFGGTGASTGTFGFVVAPWSNTLNGLRVDNNGNVGIAVADTKGYQLAVNGAAIFNKAVVKLTANWPDYVLDSSYTLPGLEDVKAYLLKNHHLPEMPSSAEVEKNGINLGENQTLLLKKVEELTLYLIEIKKENEEMKERIRKLENKIPVSDNSNNN